MGANQRILVFFSYLLLVLVRQREESLESQSQKAASQPSAELWNAGLLNVCETDDDTGKEAIGIFPSNGGVPGRNTTKPGQEQIPGPSLMMLATQMGRGNLSRYAPERIA